MKNNYINYHNFMEYVVDSFRDGTLPDLFLSIKDNKNEKQSPDDMAWKNRTRQRVSEFFQNRSLTDIVRLGIIIGDTVFWAEADKEFDSFINLLDRFIDIVLMNIDPNADGYDDEIYSVLESFDFF